MTGRLLLVSVVLLPLAGASSVALLRRRRRLLGPLATGWLAATFAAGAAAVAFQVLTGAEPAALSWRWGSGLDQRIALEGFARVMAVLVPLVAAPIAAYAGRADRIAPPTPRSPSRPSRGAEKGPPLDLASPPTPRSPSRPSRGGRGRPLPPFEAQKDRGLGRLLVWMLVFVSAMELLVLAADLLTLLIAWELVGLCSWALIGHHYREPDNPRSAAQAFLTTRFGDLGLYLAAAAAFAGAGSLDYRALGGLEGPALHFAAGGLLLAAASKSAQVPFAPWLFSAMAGPTPVSALLHSATMVAAGAYALVRLAPELEGAGWLPGAVVAVGIATVWAGGVVAALQDDLKRALAASTSSQYGLMFVAVGAASTAAAGAHLTTHAAFKSLLFLGAGVAIHAAGTGGLSALGDRDLPARGTGLRRAAALFGVGALALAAVPPLGAGWSKEEVVAAAFHHGGWLGWAVLLSGALTAFYAARLQLLAFGPHPSPAAGRRFGGTGTAEPADGYRPSSWELGGLATLAAVTVGLGLLWLPAAKRVVEAAVGGHLRKGAPWELFAGLAAIAAAFAAAWLLRRRGRLFDLGLIAGSGAGLRRGTAAWLGLPALAKLAVVRPVLALASALAAFDDRVVDAGVRAAAAVGRLVSRAFATWGERGVDGLVEALARGTTLFADGSGRFDDAAVDGAVEGVARGTGAAGAASRRLQTGAAHFYYALIALGTLIVLGVALLGAL